MMPSPMRRPSCRTPVSSSKSSQLGRPEVLPGGHFFSEAAAVHCPPVNRVSGQDSSHVTRFFRSPQATPYLLLLPAIVVILAVVLVPLLVSLWTSFTGYNLTKPATLFQWVGL